MKLIIQIPCWNEAETLPLTLRDLPKRIEGIDSIAILIIDDGSTDGTGLVAEALGVDHIVRHRKNRGLAESFRTGVDACLRLGADIIVNTDADNQYCGEDVARLVRPILDGQADVVVGDRGVRTSTEFSWGKRQLQRLGSFVVRSISGVDILDAVSGFRAFSAEAAQRLNVVTSFSYTIETLVHAGHLRLSVASVPIRVNHTQRESRLFRSIPGFIYHSGMTILRLILMFHPMRVFLGLGLSLMLIGSVPMLRFLYFFATGDGEGHIQSLIFGSVFIVMGGMALLLGLLGELMAVNRQMLERLMHKVRGLNGL